MPIYEYRCTACGVKKDMLQKLSDPPATECPSCGMHALAKQVTAAGFQLKGSGWYATDFKNSGSKPAEKKDDSKSGDSGSKGSSADASTDSSTSSSTNSSSNSSTNSSTSSSTNSSKKSVAPAAGVGVSSASE